MSRIYFREKYSRFEETDNIIERANSQLQSTLSQCHYLCNFTSEEQEPVWQLIKICTSRGGPLSLLPLLKRTAHHLAVLTSTVQSP